VSQQINLFNPIFLKQKKVLTAQAMALAIGVLLIGCALMVMYGKHSVAALETEAFASGEQLRLKQARLAVVNVEFAPREKNAALEAQIAASDAELHAMQGVEGVLQKGELGNSAGYAETFRALARQSVSGMWLTGVTVSGAELGVRGRTLDASLVPGYITRLKREPVMQGKSFATLDMGDGLPKKERVAAAVAAEAASAASPPPYVEFSLQAKVQEGEKK
jgi:hypothetical protein